MERQPTPEEIRRFNATRSGNTAPKRKVLSYELKDNFGNILARGAYALCKHRKNQIGGLLKIVPVYDTPDLPVIKGFTPKF